MYSVMSLIFVRNLPPTTSGTEISQPPPLDPPQEGREAVSKIYKLILKRPLPARYRHAVEWYITQLYYGMLSDEHLIVKQGLLEAR